MQPLARELGELELVRQPRVRIAGEPRFSAEHFVEPLPRALLGVDLLEQPERLAVLLLDLDHVLERIGCLVVVREPLDPEVGHPEVELHLLFGVVARLRLAGEHPDQIVPTPRRLVGRRKRLERLGVRRVRVEDGVVGVYDHHVQTEPVAIDRDQIAQEGDLALGLFVGDRVDLALEELHQRVPFLGLPVERLERLGRLAVSRVDPQDGLPRVDRALGARRALLRGLRELDRELQLLLFGGCPLRIGEDLDPLRLVVLREQLAIEVEHAGVRRVHLPQAREERLGRLGRVAKTPVDHPDLEQRAGLVLELGARAERVLVERDQVIPVLLLGEVLHQETHRLGMARRMIEHALVTGPPRGSARRGAS